MWPKLEHLGNYENMAYIRMFWIFLYIRIVSSFKIIDNERGFKEKDTSKIFKRFYSNRPDKFGEHSGLGLNIVKNLVDLHDGEIIASNRLDKDGAVVEIRFPSV